MEREEEREERERYIWGCEREEREERDIYMGVCAPPKCRNSGTAALKFIQCKDLVCSGTPEQW